MHLSVLVQILLDSHAGMQIGILQLVPFQPGRQVHLPLVISPFIQFAAPIDVLQSMPVKLLTHSQTPGGIQLPLLHELAHIARLQTSLSSWGLPGEPLMHK